ncbi:MAG: hypothetical protein AB7K24_04110 [Gemmataceae bacterium]
MKWYELADGTCLSVVLKQEGDRLLVHKLILGEPRAGYGGKLSWFEQDKRVAQSLRLR